ncbi:MAG: MarR family winged helix-turn-helix transcriptional regulator [Acetobacteraceae bacterium]
MTENFALEGHVGFLLRKAHQRHAALFLEMAAEHGLTPTQFAALHKTILLGRVTQNHLGRLVAMDPATIQGVVRRLTARGLLAVARDPLDRRTVVLTPTEAGLALIDAMVACAQRSHEAALAPLTPDEQSVFLSLLSKMV